MDLHDKIMNIPIDPVRFNWVKDEIRGEEHFGTIVRMAYEYGHKHARHAAAELATIQQSLQPENGPIKCADNGCAGWDNGFCAMPGSCRGVAVSG